MLKRRQKVHSCSRGVAGAPNETVFHHTNTQKCFNVFWRCVLLAHVYPPPPSSAKNSETSSNRLPKEARKLIYKVKQAHFLSCVCLRTLHCLVSHRSVSCDFLGLHCLFSVFFWLLRRAACSRAVVKRAMNKRSHIIQ